VTVPYSHQQPDSQHDPSYSNSVASNHSANERCFTQQHVTTFVSKFHVFSRASSFVLFFLLLLLRFLFLLVLFNLVQQFPLGQDILIIEDSRSQSDTPQSVRLLCTGDRPDAETSTWQHTTLTTDRHPRPRGIWIHCPIRRAAADPRHRPRSHWDRPALALLVFLITLLPPIHCFIITVFYILLLLHLVLLLQ
jgi:hypothetical protein